MNHLPQPPQPGKRSIDRDLLLALQRPDKRGERNPKVAFHIGRGRKPYLLRVVYMHDREYFDNDWYVPYQLGRRDIPKPENYFDIKELVERFNDRLGLGIRAIRTTEGDCYLLNNFHIKLDRTGNKAHRNAADYASEDQILVTLVHAGLCAIRGEDVLRREKLELPPRPTHDDTFGPTTSLRELLQAIMHAANVTEIGSLCRPSADQRKIFVEETSASGRLIMAMKRDPAAHARSLLYLIRNETSWIATTSPPGERATGYYTVQVAPVNGLDRITVTGRQATVLPAFTATAHGDAPKFLASLMPQHRPRYN